MLDCESTAGRTKRIQRAPGVMLKMPAAATTEMLDHNWTAAPVDKPSSFEACTVRFEATATAVIHDALSCCASAINNGLLVRLDEFADVLSNTRTFLL